MGLFSDNTKSSVTVYVDNLSNYDQIEWFQFQQLIESISMQSSGAREAIEAIRKKLKHGSLGQKLRALEILQLLMENSSQRFYRELIHHDKMKERFDLIIESTSEDIRVRKLLVGLLGVWATRFKDERGVQSLQDLYEKGQLYIEPRKPVPFVGLLKKSFSSYKVNTAAATKTTAIPTSKSSLAILSSVPSQHQQTDSSSNMPFNFEKSKPKIIQEVAMATQSANKLINALQHVPLNSSNWELDSAIQESYLRCEQDKKKIVCYARLVEDEEWIGTLLAANEVLLKAIDMHNTMLTSYRKQRMQQQGDLLDQEDPFADPL